MNEEKIENLSLIDLKKYACPKHQHKNEWYWECLNDCPGFATCKVGHRVSAILDAATQKEEPNQISNGSVAYNERRRNEARERCKAAIASGDPVQWCVDNLSPNKTAAKEVVHRWKTKFYDLFGYDAPPERSTSKNIQAAKEASAKKLEERIRTALESGDVLQWLMDNGKTRAQARDNYNRWKRLRPDLFEEHEAKQNTDDQDDEMSLDSFVSQYDNVVHISYSHSNELAETADEPAETADKPESKEDNFLDQLTVKRSSLVLEKEQLEAEIRERQDKIAVLDKQIEALANVYTLFE